MFDMYLLLLVQPPPTFAQSMDNPPPYSEEAPPEYSSSGVRIKDSTKTDVDRDDDNSGAMQSPPAYSGATAAQAFEQPPSSNGSAGSGSGGEFAHLPAAPVARAEVCLPAAPGDSNSAPPVVATPTAPEYDDLAARFAALSK